MYVLTIYQDADNNRAHFSSINGFTSMISPSLSFAITAANQINRKTLHLSQLKSNFLSVGDMSDVVNYGVKMYSIHTKYFQELLLVFKTNRFMSVNPIDLENDELLEGNRISHMNFSLLPAL